MAHRSWSKGSCIGCPRHINSLFADYICVDGNFVLFFVVICCTEYCHMLLVSTIEPRKRGHYVLCGEGGRTKL